RFGFRLLGSFPSTTQDIASSGEFLFLICAQVGNLTLALHSATDLNHHRCVGRSYIVALEYLLSLRDRESLAAHPSQNGYNRFAIERVSFSLALIFSDYLAHCFPLLIG